MARATVDQKMDRLDALSTDDPAFNKALKSALADKHYRVIAKAARCCKEHYLDQYSLELVAAYHYLQSGDTLKKDVRCYGKTAICETLYELDYDNADFYLTGIRYRQMEPVWGGSEDSAVNIRRICALGLTISHCPRVNIELLNVLYDEEVPVRGGAVAAIACLQPATAELMLRQKVLSGDEPWVLGECFTALLKVEPDDNVGFVNDFLQDNNEEIVEYAVLALGESRLDDAFKCLKQAWDTRTYKKAAFYQMLLRGMVLHRSESAYTHILQVIESDDHGLAMAALKQLAIYRENAKLRCKVQALAEQRGDLTALFEQAWL